jgi:hypothetical protein
MSTAERRLRPFPFAVRLANEAARASTEFGAMVASIPRLRRVPKGDGHSVVVLPGLGAGDGSTVVLRRFLRDRNYDPHGWGLGLNLAPNGIARADVEATVRALAERSGRLVSLVGWSLGGVYALRLGEMLPDLVRTIVTLGSPFWRPYTGHVPATSVYSQTDAVVPWQRSLHAAGPSLENVEIRGSHLGFGHNPAALIVIGDRLAQPEGSWRPFDPSPYGAFFS